MPRPTLEDRRRITQNQVREAEDYLASLGELRLLNFRAILAMDPEDIRGAVGASRIGIGKENDPETEAFRHAYVLARKREIDGLPPLEPDSVIPRSGKVQARNIHKSKFAQALYAKLPTEFKVVCSPSDNLIVLLVEAVLDEIRDQLVAGNRLEFRDFLILDTKIAPPRMRYQPKTKKPIVGRWRRWVTVKVANTFQADLDASIALETDVELNEEID